MKTLMRQGAPRLLIAALFCLVVNHGFAQDKQTSRKVLVKTAAADPTLAKSMHIHGVVKLTAIAQWRRQERGIKGETRC